MSTLLHEINIRNCYSLPQGKPKEEVAPEGHFTEDVVMCWFVQLLMALHHLHYRHIIHRE